MESELHILECVGCGCPVYGNCEGWFEGKAQCLESGGACTWAAIGPSIEMLDMPSVDVTHLEYQERAREAIIRSFMLPVM